MDSLYSSVQIKLIEDKSNLEILCNEEFLVKINLYFR